MPDSAILDVNELPVVRFENVPRVELSQAIVANNLPIRPAWQHFAFDSRTRDRTTKNWHNSASAMRNVTYFHRWSDLRTQFEYKCQSGSTDIIHPCSEPILCNFSHAEPFELSAERQERPACSDVPTGDRSAS